MCIAIISLLDWPFTFSTEAVAARDRRAGKSEGLIGVRRRN
jgi:hypothetical protein